MKHKITILIFLLLGSLILFACTTNAPNEPMAEDSSEMLETPESGDNTFPVSDIDVPQSYDSELMQDEIGTFRELFHPDGLSSRDEHNDHIAQTFLQVLLSNNYRAIAYIANATSVDAYKFMENIKFSSGKIVNSRILYYDEEYEAGKTYEIELLIEKSDSILFPVGKSVWELDVTATHDFYGAVPRFECITMPQANGISIPLPSFDIEEAPIINFCYRFTTNTGYYGDTDDMNSIVPKWEDDETHYADFYHGILDLGLTESVDAEEFKRAVKYYLGITNLNLSNFGYFNKNDNTVACPGHGGSWTIANLKEMGFDEDIGQYSVIIDYYMDSCRLVIAKTIQYTLNRNNDGTFTMQAVKGLYDSGFAVRSGAV